MTRIKVDYFRFFDLSASLLDSSWVCLLCKVRHSSLTMSLILQHMQFGLWCWLDRQHTAREGPRLRRTLASYSLFDSDPLDRSSSLLRCLTLISSLDGQANIKWWTFSTSCLSHKMQSGETSALEYLALLHCRMYEPEQYKYRGKNTIMEVNAKKCISFLVYRLTIS